MTRDAPRLCEFFFFSNFHDCFYNLHHMQPHPPFSFRSEWLHCNSSDLKRAKPTCTRFSQLHLLYVWKINQTFRTHILPCLILDPSLIYALMFAKDDVVNFNYKLYIIFGSPQPTAYQMSLVGHLLYWLNSAFFTFQNCCWITIFKHYLKRK